MLVLMSYVLTALALVLLVPTLVFFTEVLAGCLLPVRVTENAGLPHDRRVAVLIPAHNEGAGIKPTIEDIKPQLRPRDRIVVVADNCSDNTGAVADSLGAEVSTRNDLTKIGKGYALDWGIKYLAGNPPDVVIVIDADCRVADAAIENLAKECIRSGHPVQALDLMTAVAESPINQQVAEFAWRVKNLVRPLGLHKLNLPCQLMGTGMAFPWNIIQSAELSNGLVVEDMKLGLEVASQGKSPLFCPAAMVTSTFPTSDAGTKAQRQRWEQGHISLILSEVPALLRAAIKRRDINILAIALDLAVPPLSLLISILTAASIVSALAAIMGLSVKPFFLVAAGLVLVAAAILLAWIKHGRDVLPLRSVFLIVPYFARKISLYATLATGRKVSRWIRTDRSKHT